MLKKRRAVVALGASTTPNKRTINTTQADHDPVLNLARCHEHRDERWEDRGSRSSRRSALDRRLLERVNVHRVRKALLSHRDASYTLKGTSTTISNGGLSFSASGKFTGGTGSYTGAGGSFTVAGTKPLNSYRPGP